MLIKYLMDVLPYPPPPPPQISHLGNLGQVLFLELLIHQDNFLLSILIDQIWGQRIYVQCPNYDSVYIPDPNFPQYVHDVFWIYVRPDPKSLWDISIDNICIPNVTT